MARMPNRTKKPTMGEPDRDVLEIAARGRAEDRDRHLGAGGGLALGQETLEPAALLRGEHTRVVVDARGRRGRDQQREREGGGGEQTRTSPAAAWRHRARPGTAPSPSDR